jgi:hypothetical protein
MINVVLFSIACVGYPLLLLNKANSVEIARALLTVLGKQTVSFLFTYASLAVTFAMTYSQERTARWLAARATSYATGFA